MSHSFPECFLQNHTADQFKKLEQNGDMKHIWDYAKFYIKHSSDPKYRGYTIAEIWADVGNERYIKKQIKKDNAYISKLMAERVKAAFCSLDMFDELNELGLSREQLVDLYNAERSKMEPKSARHNKAGGKSRAGQQQPYPLQERPHSTDNRSSHGLDKDRLIEKLAGIGGTKIGVQEFKAVDLPQGSSLQIQ